MCPGYGRWWGPSPWPQEFSSQVDKWCILGRRCQACDFCCNFRKSSSFSPDFKLGHINWQANTVTQGGRPVNPEEMELRAASRALCAPDPRPRMAQ